MDRIPLEYISDPEQLTQEFERYRREGNLDPTELTENEEEQAFELMISPAATRLRPPHHVDVDSLLPYGRIPAESIDEYLIRKQALNDAFDRLETNRQNILDRWNIVWNCLPGEPLGTSARKVAVYVVYRQYDMLQKNKKNLRDMTTLKEDFVRVNREWARLDLTREVLPPAAERAFEYIY